MADVIIPSGTPGENGVFSDLKYGWLADLDNGTELPLMALPVHDVASEPDTDGGSFYGGIYVTVASTVDLSLGADGRFGIWTNTRIDDEFERLWWSQDTDDDGFPLPQPVLEPGYYIIQFGSRTDIALVSFDLIPAGPVPTSLFFTHLVGTKES